MPAGNPKKIIFIGVWALLIKNTCIFFYIYSPGSSTLIYLLQAMQNDDSKWVWHCEYHPDVNHLDIPSHWQRLGYSHETETEWILEILIWMKLLTHYVVKTKSRVALTSMTISRYVLLNVITIWLITNSIAVGRNIVRQLLVRGLLTIKSMNNPELLFLSCVQ